MSICLRLAKAPSRHVVELAAAQVRANPRADGIIQRFAAIRLKDAETGVYAAFVRHGISLPIPVRYCAIPGFPEFPTLKLSDWAPFLLETNRFARQLVGCSFEQMPLVLEEFWSRFKAVFPTHDIFKSDFDLRFAVPYYSHTDEGRSTKHEPLWVLSVHGALGRGTRRFVEDGQHQKPIALNEMGLNFLGQTFSTNFLVATMLKRIASDYPEALNGVLREFAADAALVAMEGIEFNGHRIRLIHLGTKGDLPALGRVGHFCRTFQHAPRRPSTRSPCEGICHLCMAGQESNARTGAQHVPYEDMAPEPDWERTMHTILPWHGNTPEILEGMIVDNSKLSAFFMLDVWHNFHLGMAKHWVANSFVSIVESALLPPMSMENKFQLLTEKYVSFCRENRFAMWIYEINRDTLCWPSSTIAPIGKWNKGSCSTTMMLFLDHYCGMYVKDQTDDPLLLMIVTCTCSTICFVLICVVCFPWFPNFSLVVMLVNCATFWGVNIF